MATKLSTTKIDPKQQQALRIRKLIWTHIQQNKDIKNGWRKLLSNRKTITIRAFTDHLKKVKAKNANVRSSKKHQVLEEERELERKEKKTALENDNALSFNQ